MSKRVFAVLPLDASYEEVQDTTDIGDLVKGDVRAAIFQTEGLDAEQLVKAFGALEDPESGPEMCKMAGIEMPPADPLMSKLDEVLGLLKNQGARIDALEGQPGPRRMQPVLAPQRNEGAEMTKAQTGDALGERKAKVAAVVLGRDGSFEEAYEVMRMEVTAAGGPEKLPPPRAQLHKQMVALMYEPGGSEALAPLLMGPMPLAPAIPTPAV